jgi:transcriptional regulator with XRE-family HTH domain
VASAAIGERIRATRLARGMSQRYLAEWATAALVRPNVNGDRVRVEGVSYAYISRIENGSRTPSVIVIRALATILGVTPYWLEYGEPDPALDLLRALVADEPGARERAAEYVARFEGLDNSPSLNGATP